MLRCAPIHRRLDAFFMHGCKFPARVGLLLISAVLITLLLHRGFEAPPTPQKTRPIVSYVLRGRLVEKHFQAYRDSLDRYGASLAEVLKAEAPDLLARFEAHEPARIGYQVLPTIVADLTSDERRPLGITAYSWPWTDRLIEQEQRKIVTEKLALRRAAAMRVLGSRLLLEALVRVYGRLKDQQSLIDAHIRHNRFWQAASPPILRDSNRKPNCRNSCSGAETWTDILRGSKARLNF